MAAIGDSDEWLTDDNQEFQDDNLVNCTIFYFFLIPDETFCYFEYQDTVLLDIL